MKPVMQTVVDSGFGNCKQAAVASLFDLELSMVPNFILYSDKTWVHIFNAFVWSLGWEWVGSGYPSITKNENGFWNGSVSSPDPELLPDTRHPNHKQELTDGYDVNGFLEASVPSKSFKGSTHAVIIDLNGVVVHDPNPNQGWMGINVKESFDLNHWTLYQKQDVHNEQVFTK